MINYIVKDVTISGNPFEVEKNIKAADIAT
jgi:predicted Zn-dependent protease